MEVTCWEEKRMSEREVRGKVGPRIGTMHSRATNDGLCYIRHEMPT